MQKHLGACNGVVHVVDQSSLRPRSFAENHNCWLPELGGGLANRLVNQKLMLRMVDADVGQAVGLIVVD